MKLRLYDSRQLDKSKLLFDTKALWLLLIPIMIEQMLNSFMGMVDTMMVSNVGSVAMSAVSLVDSINMLIIQIFSALAAQAMTVIFENVNGVAAVGVGIALMTVVGQTLGAGKKEEAKYYMVRLTD